jgi:hypothetical protein
MTLILAGTRFRDRPGVFPMVPPGHPDARWSHEHNHQFRSG